MMPPEGSTYVAPDTPLIPAGTYWTTRLDIDPGHPDLGLLPDRLDADFDVPHPDSVYEAGFDALELASVQLVRWGIPGLVVKCCLGIEDVMLREVKLTFRMQADGSRRRWDVMHLSGIDDKPPCNESVAIIYANASFEQSKWPRTVPGEDQLACIPEVFAVEARLGESFLKSYALDALANWEDVDLLAMCGTLFDRCFLGACGSELP